MGRLKSGKAQANIIKVTWATMEFETNVLDSKVLIWNNNDDDINKDSNNNNIHDYDSLNDVHSNKVCH